MTLNEDRLRRVLHGLERCGLEPDFMEDCGDCPYTEYFGDESIGCIARLCQDARKVIIDQYRLLQQIEAWQTLRASKAAAGLKYCVQHRECFGANHECPYHEDSDCLQTMQRDLFDLIASGSAGLSPSTSAVPGETRDAERGGASEGGGEP